MTTTTEDYIGGYFCGGDNALNEVYESFIGGNDTDTDTDSSSIEFIDTNITIEGDNDEDDDGEFTIINTNSSDSSSSSSSSGDTSSSSDSEGEPSNELCIENESCIGELEFLPDLKNTFNINS